MADTAYDLRPVRDQHVDVPPTTSLDDLAAELAPVEAGTTELLVDSRPGWSVVYSLGIEGGQLTAWRNAARDENTDSTDENLWNRSILAGQCRQIRKDGDNLTDDTGKPVTFFSPTLWRILGVPAGAPSGATEAVKKFYTHDFQIAAAAGAVLEDAGFGKKARRADPTVRSSSA